MKKLAGGVVVLVSVLAVAWLMSRPAPESKPAPDLADDSLDGLLERINRVMPELRIVAREGNKVWLTAAEGKSIWICAGLIVGTAGIDTSSAHGWQIGRFLFCGDEGLILELKHKLKP